jgi:hypothetical protein
MRRRYIDNVDVRVSHELGVGTVSLGCGRAVDFLDEGGGAIRRGGRRDGDNLMLDVVDRAGGWVGEDVLAECWCC